jgi:hypothetical protein
MQVLQRIFFGKNYPKIFRFQENAQQEKYFWICLIVYLN